MPIEPGLLPQYVSLARASTITNLSIRTLRRAIANERLRAHRVGRLVRIDVSELQRWIESNASDAPPASVQPPLQPSRGQPGADAALNAGRNSRGLGRRSLR
jgi:excisionase family DNA binding protein